MSVHGFAYLPDDGRPDRLVRFTELGKRSFTTEDGSVFIFLSTYDAKRNVLRIDRQCYECMSESEQHRLTRTHSPVTAYVHHRAGTDAEMLRQYIDVDKQDVVDLLVPPPVTIEGNGG